MPKKKTKKPPRPEPPQVLGLPFKPETLEKKVVFAFCTRGNDIYWKTTNFLLQQTNVFRNMAVFTSVSLWGPGAESLFKALEEYKCDYVCLLDSDVCPRIDTPVRLIETGKDIISCPSWMYDGGNQDIHLNLHRDESMKREHAPVAGGLEKVFNTSWACVMLSHRVLEMFVQAKEAFTKWSPLIEEKWKDLPPDSMFYEKAKALGFDIWMNWDCEFATHHKYVALDAPTLETYTKNRIFGMEENERIGRAVSLLARRQMPVAS